MPLICIRKQINKKGQAICEIEELIKKRLKAKKRKLKKIEQKRPLFLIDTFTLEEIIKEYETILEFIKGEK